MKTIGIIGAGNIGQAVAAHLLKNNIPVIISNSKDPETLEDTISNLGDGIKAVTAAEAAGAEIVLLALPWWKVKDLTQITDWNGKIIIDATNNFTADHRIEDLGESASSEVVQGYFPGANLVKVFNTLPSDVLEADPAVGNGRRVLFISGDDKEAKAEVSELIKIIGFATIDLGSLATGSKLQQPGEVFSLLNLVEV